MSDDGDFFTREDALEVLEQTLGGELQGYFGLRRDLRCVGDREWEIRESNWNRPIAAGTLAEMFGVAKRHRWLPGDVARFEPTDEELFPPIGRRMMSTVDSD